MKQLIQRLPRKYLLSAAMLILGVVLGSALTLATPKTKADVTLSSDPNPSTQTNIPVVEGSSHMQVTTHIEPSSSPQAAPTTVSSPSTDTTSSTAVQSTPVPCKN